MAWKAMSSSGIGLVSLHWIVISAQRTTLKAGLLYLWKADLADARVDGFLVVASQAVPMTRTSAVRRDLTIH